MENPISQKVLEKIKNEKITPKPEWNFLLLRAVVFGLLAFFLVFGALSIGIIFDLFSKLEFEKIISRPRGFRILFLSLPYIWFIIAGIFSVLAVSEFFKTRHGYKYKTRNVILSFIILMLMLGGLFHALGFCNSVENYLENYFPIYSRITKTQQKVWSQPEMGLLSGMIIADDEAGCHCLRIRDWKKEIWEVDYSKAFVGPKVRKQKGEMIKILGTKKGGLRFEAEEIRPWVGIKMKSVKNPRVKGKMMLRKEK